LVLLVGLAAVPLLVLRVAFPSSGPFPFLGIDLALIVATCAIGVTWLPASHRALRAGLVLYGLTAIVVFLFPNPIGGNVVRLTVSFGPALLVALASLYRPAHRRARLFGARRGAADPREPALPAARVAQLPLEVVEGRGLTGNDDGPRARRLAPSRPDGRRRIGSRHDDDPGPLHARVE